jgi:hypothetical protein
MPPLGGGQVQEVEEPVRHATPTHVRRQALGRTARHRGSEVPDCPANERSQDGARREALLRRR